MRTFLCLVLMAAAVPAFAQNKTCPQDEYRLFDFWIGEWDVFAQGAKVGENSIKPILDGCVLQEMWAGAGGSKGSSFNYFNPKTKQWHQFWVWGNGTTLPMLSGNRKDNQMTLSGVETKKGQKLHHRITWTKNEDGTVRQYWENSTDEGKTWKVSFDGLYKKKS